MPPSVAVKAIERGTRPMADILQRIDVTAEDLARRLDVEPDTVYALLERPVSPPALVLDLEDTRLATGDDDLDAIRSAVASLSSASRPADSTRPLTFVRVRALAEPNASGQLRLLLSTLGDAVRGRAFPLDGLVYPKIRQPDEIDQLFRLLSQAEDQLALEDGRLRVSLLIETAWAAAQLTEIVRRALPRLAGLIVGLVDYSADLRMSEVVDDHPLADWLRAGVANIAGAAGVPAIDGMTLALPVSDATLDERANRNQFLDRMALVYADTLRAARFGMAGKWVGHPAQLFASLLAWRAQFPTTAIASEVERVQTYTTAAEVDGRAVGMISGSMSDRATDRQARAYLRTATILGRLDPELAERLGIISAGEVPEARRLFALEQGG